MDEEADSPAKRRRVVEDETEWPPKPLAEQEQRRIAELFLKQTGVDALTTVECSFCGQRTTVKAARHVPCGELDITLLEEACDKLKTQWGITEVKPYKMATVVDDLFVVCPPCGQSVRGGRFATVPAMAYANGCWIGERPRELGGLSLMEEQCVALARATKCVFKLKGGGEGQTVARGNVCILPQDPRLLGDILPPPLNEMTQEVAVVFLRNQEEEVRSIKVRIWVRSSMYR